MDNISNMGQPRLKKIKRPINRTLPQTSAQPVTPTMPQAMPDQSAQAPGPQSNPFRQAAPAAGAGSQIPQTPAVSANNYTDSRNINTSEELNEYLDGSNVPSKDVDSGNIYDNPQYIDEDTYESEVYGRSSSSASLPEWLNIKTLSLIIVVALFIGVIIGKLVFAESKIVRNGLQGVVVNAEVPRGRARCGIAERAQGCVLYIMNPQRQDMRAKDFYDLAAQMTGRQRFMIETGNMRYANSKISPGSIVQLNIPPL